LTQVATKPRQLLHGPKPFDEDLIITFPEKNLLSVIAPGDQMVEQSFGMNSRMARHPFFLSPV
jgi:hypothetical protein